MTSSAAPNDTATEVANSINQIYLIAALRVAELVVSDDRLGVHGGLSTHVLDTHSGRSAEGVAAELVELSDLGASRVSTRTFANADDEPISR